MTAAPSPADPGSLLALLTPERVAQAEELARVFFTSTDITVNLAYAAIGAAILLGLLLGYLLLINPMGFWGAMMDEMGGYMASGGHSVAYSVSDGYTSPSASGSGYSEAGYSSRRGWPGEGGQADLTPEQRSLFPSLELGSVQAPLLALQPLSGLAAQPALLGH